MKRTSVRKSRNEYALSDRFDRDEKKKKKKKGGGVEFCTIYIPLLAQKKKASLRFCVIEGEDAIQLDKTNL